MPASEEAGSGPVVHDNRRIDPVTGQVRGKHAASKPAGTTGAGRPAAAAEPDEAGNGEPEDHVDDAAAAEAAEEIIDGAEDIIDGAADEDIIEGIVEDVIVAERQDAVADAEARLAERTADLQRLQAEYANYRKRVDRDRAAVREQAVAATLAGLLPVLDAISQAKEHGELSGGFKSVADSLAAALGRLGLVAYGEKGDPFDPKIHEALTSSYSPDVAEDTCIEILQPGYKVGDRILRPARVAVAEPAIGPDGISNQAEWPDEEGN
jgi:molecular chaperone GrpE